MAPKSSETPSSVVALDESATITRYLRANQCRGGAEREKTRIPLPDNDVH